MASTKKLDLADALEDEPETRKALEALQQEATSMKSYASALVASFQAIVEAQNAMCRSTDALAQQLDRYKEQNFALKQDFMCETVRKLGESVQQMKSWQEMLATQMDQAMVCPVTDFITTDLMEVNRQRELFELASQEHDNAMVKYSKTSKRRETDKARFEANAELYMARKKFHEVALQYFSVMNSLEHKKKLTILNPLMSFMHAQLSYFKMGHEILTDEMSRFLTTVTIEVNKLQGDYNSEVKRLAARRDKLEKEYASRYNPDPDPTDPFVTFEPPNLELKAKAGHLFVKGNRSGQNKGWERSYFFTRNGSLVSQRGAQDLEDVLRLDGAVASLCDVDDRRYVFQIVSRSELKPVYLQAENQRTCEEWIAAIHNIAAELHELAVTTQMVTDGPQGNKPTAVREERIRIRNWVDEQAKQKLQQQQQEQQKMQQHQQHRGLHSKKKRGGREPMIQQHLVPQTGESGQLGTEAPGDKGRTNPFSSGALPSDGNIQFSQVYSVRFLGSTEVQKSRGVGIVYDTMRRVMQARAAHGVFKMVESTMVITTYGIQLKDPSTHEVRTDFRMKDISFCASHSENQRLLGFITKSNTKHACHIFECDKSAKEICDSISCAMQIAYEHYVHHQGQNRETLQGTFQQQQQLPEREHQANRKHASSRSKSASLQSFPGQPVGRYGQIDALAAQNSWSGSSVRTNQGVSLAGDLQQLPSPGSHTSSTLGSQPLIQIEPQEPTSTGSHSGSNQASGDALGMFNPFFQDTQPQNATGSNLQPKAAPPAKPKRSASNALELDPLLVPSSTPVDQSVLSSGDMSAFDMDLMAALSQASFGSPRAQFFNETSPTYTPPHEAGHNPVRNMSGLKQNLRYGEGLGSSETTSSTSSSSHAMSPALQFSVDSPARPAAPPPDLLGSAVNAAMQVAQATAAASLQNLKQSQENGSTPPPGEMKKGESVSSLLSDLSE